MVFVALIAESSSQQHEVETLPYPSHSSDAKQLEVEQFSQKVTELVQGRIKGAQMSALARYSSGIYFIGLENPNVFPTSLFCRSFRFTKGFPVTGSQLISRVHQLRCSNLLLPFNNELPDIFYSCIDR